MSKRFLVAAVAALGLSTASEAGAQGQWATCTMREVAVFSNRVHVLCASTPQTDTIIYFAIPTTNQTVLSSTSDAATRFLELALKAWGTPTVLNILYEPNDTTTGPTFGCFASNCRPVLGATISLPAGGGALGDAGPGEHLLEVADESEVRRRTQS